jgi:hypothetical protein
MIIYYPNIKTLEIESYNYSDDCDLRELEKSLDKTFGFNNWFYSFKTAKQRINFYKKELNEIF